MLDCNSTGVAKPHQDCRFWPEPECPSLDKSTAKRRRAEAQRTVGGRTTQIVTQVYNICKGLHRRQVLHPNRIRISTSDTSLWLIPKHYLQNRVRAGVWFDWVVDHLCYTEAWMREQQKGRQQPYTSVLQTMEGKHPSLSEAEKADAEPKLRTYREERKHESSVIPELRETSPCHSHRLGSRNWAWTDAWRLAL